MTLSHADFIAQYRVPVTAPDAPRPVLTFSRRGEGRARSLVGDLRRTTYGRRLAYIDSHFPWQRSGFRYADALALHEARPDTVFFSMYEMDDAFPAPVLPLSNFPRLAPSLGITDIYGVFLSFMAGVLGLRRDGGDAPEAIEGLDLSGVLRKEGIRAHAGLYPGGGFVATQAGFSEARRLVETADQVFSWTSVVLENVPGVIRIDPALIDTGFYAMTPVDFAARPLELLFVADAKKRKGLDVALAAMQELEQESVHLHVVGPHDPTRSALPASRVTFHGWLEREALRTLHQRCHVFISPVTAERPEDRTGDGGITDGFPTAAAAEAASSGLLLVTANPDRDHRYLTAGRDHIEVAPTARAVANAVLSVLTDPASAHAIAESGARAVRERLDVRVGAATRLAQMGFRRGRTPYTAPPRTPSRVAVRRPIGGERDRELRSAIDGLVGEIRAVGASLKTIEAEHRRLGDELRVAHQHLADEVRATRGDLMSVGQLVLDDETAVRQSLAMSRATPEYEAAFLENDPLVTVCIPTYTNHEALLERSIPSVLTQDYSNIEIVVVGDCAPPETAAAIARLDDPRIRYENLSVRGPYPEDPRKRWLVAGTEPLNRALALARGTWIAINNDDDALRINHVSTLLELAQRSRDEVVYGRLQQHAPDGSTEIYGDFPPASHGFGWQLALQHHAMRLFEFKLSAALFDEPGDWDRARRMLRAGVRFRMTDAVLCDYYPSLLWKPK